MIPCVFFIIIFGVAPVFSQVNTEQMRSKSAEEGFSGYFDLNLRLKTGNIEIFDTGGGLRLEHQSGSYLTFLVTNIQYAAKKSDPFINRGFTHIRSNRTVSPRLKWEVYSQHEFNEFFRLFSRALLGTGGRFAIHESTRSAFYYGSSYMLEREHIDVIPGSKEKSKTWSHRWSNYIVMNWQASGEAALVNSLYIQPRFNGFDDVRILNEFELRTALTTRLSTTLQISIRYDSEPPVRVKNTDAEIRNSLRLVF